MNRWALGVACVLSCALALGCKASEGGSGTGAGFGGTGGTSGAGGTAGTGGVGGTAGTGGVAGTAGVGATGGTGGVGGTGGDSGTGGTGGDSGTGGTGGDSGTGGTGGVGGGITIGMNRVQANQVCQRLAELQCIAEEACCTEATRKYPSQADCISNQRTVCETNFRVAQIGADPDAGYSIDSAEDAFDYFEMLTSTCDTNVVEWGTSTQGFLRMMQGTKSANSFCMPTGSSDYGAAFSCRVDSGLTCVPAFPGMGSLPPTSWTCKPRSGVGGNCYTDLNCQDGLRCQAPETLSECVARKALGSTCSYPLECESLFCEGNECVEANVPDAYCLGG